MWDTDRIHVTAEGHRRTALAAAASLAEEAAWVRGFVAPWVGRRLRGPSSGEGREPKRPVPLVLPRA